LRARILIKFLRKLEEEALKWRTDDEFWELWRGYKAYWWCKRLFLYERKSVLRVYWEDG